MHISEAEERYQALFNSLDCIYLHDLEGRFIDANQATLELLGYEREDIPSLDLSSVLDDEQLARARGLLAEVIRTGALKTAAEFVVRRKDGDYVSVEIRASVVSRGGEPYAVLGIARDITVRKQLAASLSKAQFSVDHVADAVHWLDRDGRILDAGLSMCARLGYSRDELLAMSVFDITVGLSPEAWPERWRLHQQQGPLTFERVQRTRSGEIIPVEIWSSIVDYEGQEVMLVIARDISERKRAEAELALTGYSVDHASDSVFWLDPNGRIVFVSESTCERHGYSRDELMAMTVYDLDPDLSQEHWTENWRRIKAEGVMHIETTHRTKDGEVIPLELKANYVAFGGAEYNCVFGRDITERRRVEEALRERDEQLRQSQKMEAVGQLAGGIAHDFNNLLAAVVGYSDLLLAREGAFDLSVREDIEEIRRAADRASSLTRQILAFSRRQALRPTVASLNVVLEGMSPLLRHMLGEDIDLVTVADPDLGLVEVDIHQFEQVLMNLAANARDAMPSGGRLTLETANVELDEAYCRTHFEAGIGPHVMLAVSDTGIGMDEATVERIFEPFFTTKAGDKGTGLGLSMVYGTVKQSNGSISVTSEPGEGTSFEIYLPRLTAEDPQPTQAVADGEPALGSETILVVEDELSLQRLVARVLKNLGYRVIVAGTAAEALQLARQEANAIDMLLTDVVLPGNMQGNDLARELLAIKPGLAVLHMSGYTRNAIVHAGRLDPGVNFLQKPFTPEALGNAVREVLK